jgi:hypothetical protein
MKISVKILSLIAIALVSTNAIAYSPEMKKEICKKPKFREFNLPEYKAPDYKEVAPESEFSFTLSAWADPESIKLTVKKQPLPYKVESTSTFHRVKAKLPASFNGQHVRIDASVKAALGCDDQTGWLVKVSEK